MQFAEQDKECASLRSERLSWKNRIYVFFRNSLIQFAKTSDLRQVEQLAGECVTENFANLTEWITSQIEAILYELKK